MLLAEFSWVEVTRENLSDLLKWSLEPMPWIAERHLRRHGEEHVATTWFKGFEIWL